VRLYCLEGSRLTAALHPYFLGSELARLQLLQSEAEIAVAGLHLPGCLNRHLAGTTRSLPCEAEQVQLWSQPEEGPAGRPLPGCLLLCCEEGQLASHMRHAGTTAFPELLSGIPLWCVERLCLAEAAAVAWKLAGWAAQAWPHSAHSVHPGSEDAVGILQSVWKPVRNAIALQPPQTLLGVQ
jgi:hypothetical protein